jgi:hypothetical protein
MSLLSTIQTALVSAIDTMTSANDYNFDYAVQNEDFNKTTFPLINIYLVPNEESFETNLFCMNEMRNYARFQLHCYNKALVEGCNNRFLNNYILFAMLYDIKRMIGHNYTLNGICEGILYRRTYKQPSGLRNDIFIPEKLIIEVDIPYTELR